MRLSIVVPCYNEEAVLDSLDERLRGVLRRVCVPYEICYIDDGSSDGTLGKLRALTDKNGDTTRYVSFSRNFGKEAAMLAGLRETTGDAVVLIDADLQHPPELIEQMLELYRHGQHGQVVARRTRDGDQFLRSALSRLY